MVVLFTLISISRYNNGANTMNMNESLLLYISEGPIRFSGEKWKKPLTTNGDVNLNYFKHLIGAKTFWDIERERNTMCPKQVIE